LFYIRFPAVIARCTPQPPVDHNLLTQANYQQGYRSDIEYADESTHRKAATQPKHPKNDQNNRYRPQHCVLLFLFYSAIIAG
jgi:hypothetical protein